MMYWVLAIPNLFSLLQIDWYLHIWQNIIQVTYTDLWNALHAELTFLNSICGFQSIS